MNFKWCDKSVYFSFLKKLNFFIYFKLFYLFLYFFDMLISKKYFKKYFNIFLINYLKKTTIIIYL